MARPVVLPVSAFALEAQTRPGLLLGYAGVYGSFLLHAETASAKYGIPTIEILIELGRRKMVGGQEDMITDVALDLVRARDAEKLAS